MTSLAPVDLNSLMAILERTLAKAYGLRGDAREAALMANRAQQRAEAIHRVLWDPQLHAYSDYDFVHHTLTHQLTAATVYPLYAGVATKEEAREVTAAVRGGLLRPGGLATTRIATGQQWDEPNGWAPLHLIAVEGLTNYGETDLAEMIAERWVDQNISEYEQEGKLVEKYNVVMPSGGMGGGGEYATQIGFGWTNGVLLALISRYPALAEKAQAARSMEPGTPGE